RPWLRVPAEHYALAVDIQDGKTGSVLEHYRQTLTFRKAHRALTDGDMEFLDLDEDVLAFTRKKGEDRLLFVFNLRGGPQEVKLPQRIAIKELVGMPGLSGSLVEGTVLVEALDGFCARI